MTRAQVELAWGWPCTIEPLSSPPGAERWEWRSSEGVESVRRLPPPVRLRSVDFVGDRVARVFIPRD
jgi:hypothetical protein